jgi:hypothetical protein
MSICVSEDRIVDTELARLFHWQERMKLYGRKEKDHCPNLPILRENLIERVRAYPCTTDTRNLPEESGKLDQRPGGKDIMGVRSVSGVGTRTCSLVLPTD